MKKLAFSAVAVLAIVSSALAFATPQDIVFCDDINQAGIDCSVPTNARLQSGTPLIGTLNCAATATVNCPAVPVFQAL